MISHSSIIYETRFLSSLLVVSVFCNAITEKDRTRISNSLSHPHLLLNNKNYFQDRFGVKLLKDKTTTLEKNKSQVNKMNYYLPRYDVPLVLGLGCAPE